MKRGFININIDVRGNFFTKKSSPINLTYKVYSFQKTSITSTGRTDKGVHALCQYGHADIDVDITEHKLKRALHSNLPDDIHVIETKIVRDDFHARYNVKSKEYKYYINI